MTGAGFADADLSDAYFYNVNAAGADFSRADMRSFYDESTNSSYAGANFSNAALTYAHFGSNNSNGSGPDLEGANFSHASLVYFNGNGTRNAANANWTDARVYGGDYGFDVYNAGILDLSNVGPGANLSYADLSSWCASGENMSGANLSHAYLGYFGNVDLSGADLSHVRVRDNAYLYDTNLAGANLAGAQLNGLHAENTNWQDVDLTDANFYGAQVHEFPGATFSNTTCPDGSNSDFNFGQTCDWHVIPRNND